MESSTVKGAFSGFLLPQKSADLGCLICCDEVFSFCNTSLILTSAAPAAEEAGHAHAAGRRQPRWSACSRLGEGCPEDGLPSRMQFPWLVMFAPEPRSQHFHLTLENMPLNKNHTLTSHNLLLQPAAKVLSYINLQQARFDILTHLRCDSLLIYFKKFQIQGSPTMKPVYNCPSAYVPYCCAPGSAELPVQVNASPTKYRLKASVHEVS